MAKSNKSAKSDRRQAIDQIRRKQKRADKRQGTVIVGVCVAIALLIVGAAAWSPIKTALEKRSYAGQSIRDIGEGPEVCGERTSKDATGSGEHLPTGTQVDYPDSPPAFGAHWNELGIAPAPLSERFYTPDSRPELEALVHNLEHGYTILWYDEEIADDSEVMGAIKGIAATLDANDTNQRLKFKAAPWTSEDGEPFPEGQHIAFTHWSVDPDTQKQHGTWQYCSALSGEALEDFMIDYPFTDSPEPFVP